MKIEHQKFNQEQKNSFLSKGQKRALLAGISSIIAGVSTHPIDTCKIKMQIQKPLVDGSRKYRNLIQGILLIAKEEGWRKGVYKGIEATILENSCSILRLGLYEPIKSFLGQNKKDAIWKKFAAGALSGMIGSAIANPADLLKIRSQASSAGEYLTIQQHMKDIYKNHGGIKGFYTGLAPTVIRAALLNSTKLGTYDSIKHAIIDNGYMKDGYSCQFITSIFAGFIMTIVTSPMDNIKTRIMNQKKGIKSYEGIMDCAFKMFKNEGGIYSFYKGFGPQWARFAPFTTIQLLSWEALRKICNMQSI